ncbi:NAD-dependent epimerase/dehydratase family protein [Cryobacterium suzukii]|nr:NAD-dependent epimerase/dehydratase family protein [Cryobacterium suzukii]
MKILVTGANGFVGRHLSSHLVEAGHEVTAAVRTAGAAPAGTNEVVIGDLGPDTVWTDLLMGNDVVIHLAARVHVMHDTAADPLSEFRRVNTAGTGALARAAAQQGVARLVFLSSIKVNGEGTSGKPYTAFDEPRPEDPYAISKHEAEMTLREVEHETGLDIVIVRSPLVYGPSVGGNFAKTLALARRGLPLPLGSVRNRRTMTSVWNLVDLLEKSASDISAAGALVLAGDQFSPSTAQLFREISTAMKKTSRLFPCPLALLRLAGRVTGRSAIIERLAESLEVQAGSSSTGWKWEPPFEFAASIRRTVAWYLGEERLSSRKDAMRIAIVTQYYAPEVIRIPDTLARRLAALGHEVRVITGFPNYPDGGLFPGYQQRWNHVENLDGVQLRRVPLVISHSYNPVARMANYLTFAGSAALAWRWVRSADVVYVYATQMTPAIGPSLWHVLFRTPYVLHIQDLWPESVTGSSMVSAGIAKRAIGGLLNPWLRFLYRTAAATIAIAPSMARMLVERGVPQNRMHTVLNWAATEPDASESEIGSKKISSSDQVSIVYAGNLGDYQSLDTVIEAANSVKHIPNLRVRIVGSGVAEKRLRELARRLDARNVTFTGRVAPEDMGEIHAESDFQIVSLKNLEIFDGTIPSKLQESLSHGIPVISTVRGDVETLVRANGIGFACDPENSDQLAKAFIRATELEPEQRARMGETARQCYSRLMSIDSGVAQIEAILRSVSRRTTHKGTWTKHDPRGGAGL